MLNFSTLKNLSKSKHLTSDEVKDLPNGVLLSMIKLYKESLGEVITVEVFNSPYSIEEVERSIKKTNYPGLAVWADGGAVYLVTKTGEHYYFPLKNINETFILLPKI